MKICGFNKTTLLDYPGRVACTIFLGGCNFRCPFCQNGALVVEPDTQYGYSEDEILAFLKKRKGILDGVCVSGGEPTLAPELPEFLGRIRELGYDKLAVAGGVAANSRIRGDFQAACDAAGIRLFVPPLKLCGDNAAMIGCQAYYEYLRGARGGSELNAWANMEISEVPFYGHA